MLIVHQMTAMKVSDGNRLVFVPEIESTEKKKEYYYCDCSPITTQR